MRATAIKPGWHRIELHGGEMDTVEVLRVDRSDITGGESVVFFKRYLSGGWYVGRTTARYVKEAVTPSAKFMAVIGWMAEVHHPTLGDAYGWQPCAS